MWLKILDLIPVRVWNWKRIEKKSDELYVKWIRYDNPFNGWISKGDTLWNLSWFFPELCSSYQDIKVKIDLSSYTTKSDGENVTGVHTSSFPSKNDLASLKSDIDKLNVEKLKYVSNSLENLM